ncbi:MAG: hypothetical protein FJ026_14340 [Chloroflexi bacterium]|nr:hypothetical protein [Chloroflexota bacterium]
MSEEQVQTQAPLPEQPQSPPPRYGDAPQPSRRDRDEKEEKAREEQEKQHEKEEKGRGWGRDPLGGLIWALILISAGLIFLAQSPLGLVDWERLGGAWNAIFIAVGLILLFEVLVRLLVPAYRRPVGGTLVFACIMLALGVGGLVGWQVTGPLILIAIGVGTLLAGLLRGRL